MINIQDIQKQYNKITVLDVPSLTINQGESIGLVGNNGAGKSTLLSLILDIIQANTGTIYSKNVPVNETEAWKFYTGSFLNESFLIPYLTPYEYLSFVASLHKISNEQRDAFFAEHTAFFSIEPKAKTLIRELSAGNRNKIGILGALLPKPEILILDEPFSFLDPTSQSWLKTTLKKLHQEGMTMLISSHDLAHITEISDRMILLEKGKVIEDKPKTEETLGELETYFTVRVNNETIS